MENSNGIVNGGVPWITLPCAGNKLKILSRQIELDYLWDYPGFDTSNDYRFP